MRLKCIKVIISIVLAFAMLIPSVLPISRAFAVGDNNVQKQSVVSESDKKQYLVKFKNNEKEKIKNKISKLGANVKKEYKMFDILKIELSKDMLDSLKKDSDILAIEPDYTFKLRSETTPWGVENVNAPNVHKSGITGSGVKIAVFDTGISTTHPELDVKGGVSLVDGVDSYKDDNGHGTLVSGVISSMVNGTGIIGVAPSSSLYSVKVLDKDGVGNYSSVIDGIDWAIENKINIINMSYGASEYSAILEDAINKAYDNNILIFAAAGNEGAASSGSSVEYPAKYENVVAVGAVDRNNNRASFSSTGKELDLMAPGVDIYSTLMNGNYGTASGTSVACPHAAAVAALVWSKEPQKTNTEVSKILDDTATKTVLNDTLYGNGIVNASTATGIDISVTPHPTSTPLAMPTGNPKDKWIKLELDKDTANVGDVVKASIKINNIENCVGCQVNINYDPEILQPVDLDTGLIIDEKSKPKEGDLFTESEYIPFSYVSNNSKKGYVSIAASYLNLRNIKLPNKHTGTVASIGFKVLKENAAPISIEEYVEFNSKIEGSMLFDSVNGKLPIGSYSIIQPSTINAHLPESVKKETKLSMSSTNMVMSSNDGGSNYSVCGYIDVSHQYSQEASAEVRQGFTVDICKMTTPLTIISTTTTDQAGYFQKDFVLPMDMTEDIVFRISKTGYLCRLVKASRYTNNLMLGTKESPVLMTGGDFCVDGNNAINMSDQMIIASLFGTSSSSDPNNFRHDLDLNKDDCIDMQESMIIAQNFNKTSADYPSQEVYLNQDINIGSVDTLNNTYQINQSGVLNLNGKTMRVFGNLKNNNEKIVVNNGKLIVEGVYTHEEQCTNSYLDLSNGCMEVKGNVNFHAGTININGGYLETNEFYLGKIGELIMTNDLDYLKVNGNMIIHSNKNHTGNLTAGVLELKSGFTVNVGLGFEGIFLASGTHKVLLSKETGLQTVNMSNSGSKFNILILTRDNTTQNYYFNPPGCYNTLILRRDPIQGLDDGKQAPTGEYTKTFIDMNSVTPGFNVSFARKYNSVNNEIGAFGKGWTFGYDSKIKYNSTRKSYEVFLPDGDIQEFIGSSGVYTSVNSRNKLEMSGSTFVLTTKEQYKYYYEKVNNQEPYVLKKICDKVGNYILIGDISSSGVRTITDTTGKTYTIDYQSTNIGGTYYNLIKKITDNTSTEASAKRVVEYNYTDGKLTSVKSATGNTVYYVYSTTTGLLEWIKTSAATGYSDYIEAIQYQNGKMWRNIDSSGKAKEYTYSPNVTQVVDKDAVVYSSGSIFCGPSLMTTTVEYDKTLFIQKETVTKGNQPYSRTIDFSGLSAFREERSTTDFNGNKTIYERDLRGNISKVINPDGSTKCYGYNDSNDMIWELDEEGEYTLYVYSGGLLSKKAKLLQKIKDTEISNYLTINSSNESKFSITEYNYYTYSSTPISNPESESVTNPTYRMYGLLASETQIMASGNIVTNYRYYANGNIAWIKNPETGMLTRYSDITFTEKGWNSTETSPKGNAVESYYNKNGQLYKQVQKPSTLDRQSIKVTVYDGLGRKVQEVSPNLCALYYNNSSDTFAKQDIGYRYIYYGRSGAVQTVIDPLNNSTTYISDFNGSITSETKPNGTVYEYEYDGLNRMTKKWFLENANDETPELLEEYIYGVDPITKHTVKTFKKYIDATTSVDTITKSDYEGKVVYQKNPDNGEVNTQYYKNGMVKKVTDPRGYNTYFNYGLYDSANNCTYDEKWSAFMVDVGGATKYKYSKTVYDKAGRVVKLLEENDKTGVSYSEYDSSGDGYGEIPTTFKETINQYFKDGMTQSIQVVNGTNTQYNYDDDRNVKSEAVTVDTGRTLTTEYETNYLGKTQYKTTCVRKGDISGNSFDDNSNIYVSTKFDYDVEGNLTTTTGPLIRTVVNNVYSYANIANTTFDTTNYYDEMNRIIGVSQPGIDETPSEVNNLTTTLYNWEGQPLMTTDANGDTTEYEYDLRGLLVKLRKGSNIIGVTDSKFTTTGTWTTETKGGSRKGELKYTSTSGYTANWSKLINSSFYYDVYVKCPYAQDGTTSASYQVYNGTTLLDTVTVNQNTNKGNWVNLGTYYLESDKEAKVVLTTNGTKTYADAVKFERKNKNVAAYKYDLAGRLKEQVNPMDYIEGASIDDMKRTVYIYDGMGRIETTGFKGSQKQINPLTTEWNSEPVAIDITTKTVDYDTNGNVIKVTDGEGNISQYSYTPSNQVERQLEPELRNDNPGINIKDVYSKKIEYDTLGRKVLESNVRGYVTDRYYINTWYQYNDVEKTMLVKTATNSNNVEAEARLMVKETYDFGGNLKSKMDANNLIKATIDAKKIDYIYNSVNRAKSVVYPGDGEANVTGSTLPERKGYYQYDYFGNLKKEFETYKMKQKADVNTYTSITKVKEYSYDNQGRVLLSEEYQSDSKAGTLIQKSYRYDRNGNKRYETDGNLNETQYKYDWLGRVISKSISYIDLKTSGRIVTHSNRYSYDENGNVTMETDVIADSTKSSPSIYAYLYDSQNRLIEKKDQNVVVQRLEYYNNGLQKSSYDAVNSATGTKLRLTSFNYDKNGRLKSTTDPQNTADSSYPYNHSTSSNIKKYDYAGNLIEEIDGNQNTTEYKYDVFNRLEEVKNKDIDEKYKYDYDNNGNMTKQTSLKLVSGAYVPYRTMDYKYNDGNLLTESKTQLGNKTNYSYYADGSVKEKTDRNAAKTSYVYDIHARNLLQKTEKTGATAIGIEYQYDKNDNLTYVIDSTGTTIRTYDARNRVSTKQVPNIGIISYKYDILSTRTEFSELTAETCEYPVCANSTTANKTTKVYDKSKRLKYVVDGDGDTTGTIIATYTYNNDGSRRSLVYGNDFKEEYVYWEDGNLKNLINKNATNAEIDNYQYQYDGAHNQIRKYEKINSTPKGTTTYEYDKMNRLKKVTEPSNKITEYTFDPAGNRKNEVITEGTKVTTNTYDNNVENLLKSINSVVKVNNSTTETHNIAYGHDANGNQTSVTKDGVLQNTYDYDLINRMTAVKNSGGANIATYIYNGDGLRVSKTEGTKTTRYLYEYDKVILEVDGSNNQVARNIYGTNLLMRTMNDQVPAGQTFCYMYNGHGDVTALLNRSTGKLAATYYYDAFGNIPIGGEQYYNVNGNPTTEKYNNSILYAGYQYDKESGLYYLNARMYDPKIARFLQEDSVSGNARDPLSLNQYTYCNNEPIMYTDPTGHTPVWIRDIVNKYNGSITWDSKTKKAYVKVNGKSAYFNGNIFDGKMYIDDEHFQYQFGLKQSGKIADLMNAAKKTSVITKNDIKKLIPSPEPNKPKPATTPNPFFQYDGKYIEVIDDQTYRNKYASEGERYLNEYNEALSEMRSESDSDYDDPNDYMESQYKKQKEAFRAAPKSIIAYGKEAGKTAAKEAALWYFGGKVIEVLADGTKIIKLANGTLKAVKQEEKLVEEVLDVSDDVVKGAIKANANPKVDNIIKKISKKLKVNGKCDGFAKKLVEGLEKEGVDYKIIRIDSKAGVYSNKAGEAIGDGYHYGVKVGDVIYDNLTTNGMKFKEWLTDIGADGRFKDITWDTAKEIINK